MEFFLGQLVALIAFFAFPAIQYVLLKSYAKNEGNPELWYLPRFGFRLVIRNLPGKKTLVDIKYRALLRQIISASSESSVATFKDQRLIQNEDFFLFPGTDQILISFKLKKSEDDVLYFVHTDKLGDEIESIAFSSFSSLISDYVATLENWFILT